MTARADLRQLPGNTPGRGLAALCLSALEIHVEPDTFRGVLVPYSGDEGYRKLQASADLFAYRVKDRIGDSQVLVVPLNEPVPEDTPSLQVRDRFATTSLLWHGLSSVSL
jgi:hypothetical protein